jgi:hypothetical protein
MKSIKNSESVSKYKTAFDYTSTTLTLFYLSNLKSTQAQSLGSLSTLIFYTAFLVPIHQEILLCLPSKCIKNLTIFLLLFTILVQTIIIFHHDHHSNPQIFLCSSFDLEVSSRDVDF